jgi:hypothetical protein
MVKTWLLEGGETASVEEDSKSIRLCKSPWMDVYCSIGCSSCFGKTNGSSLHWLDIRSWLESCSISRSIPWLKSVTSWVVWRDIWLSQLKNLESMSSKSSVMSVVGGKQRWRVARAKSSSLLYLTTLNLGLIHRGLIWRRVESQRLVIILVEIMRLCIGDQKL